MIWSILCAVLVFGVLVVVHEAGHFTMAKNVGVRVLRFSIGYPPKLFGIRRGETEYAVGATPFGGYVRMLGDEVGEEPKPEELTNYLHEVGLDLIGAAREHGAIQARSEFGDALRAVASRLASEHHPGAEARAAVPSESGHNAALAVSMPPPSAEPMLALGPANVIGRELKADEALLVNEVCRQPKVDEAIKSLAEHPPRALIDAYCQRAFPTQSLGKRVLIVLAGPLANIIFAPLLLTVVFMTGVPQLLPVVGKTTKDLPAEKAGLRTGDRILAVGGQPMESWSDFSTAVKSGNGSPIKLEIQRQQDGKAERSTIVITPTRLEQKTIYGTNATTWVIGVQPRGDETTKRYGPLGAVKEAGVTSYEMTIQMAVGIASIFKGSTPVREALGGPIMIAQMAGEEAHRGFANLAMFTVMLSLELGIINLLPVPLLDGGHLLFFAFEGARGKPLELRYREAMLQVGLFLLVALMAFVIFNDISRIVQG
jgi:regulator of sigma E protease